MYQHESKQPPHKNLVFRQQNTKIFLKLPTLVEELAKTIKIWSQFHIFVKTTSKISSILREKRLIFYPNFLGTRRSFLVIFGQVHAEFSLRHWVVWYELLVFPGSSSRAELRRAFRACRAFFTKNDGNRVLGIMYYVTPCYDL